MLNLHQNRFQSEINSTIYYFLSFSQHRFYVLKFSFGCSQNAVEKSGSVGAANEIERANLFLKVAKSLHISAH